MIALKNVYYMLAYSFKSLRYGKYTKFTYENFSNSYEILVAIFILGINNQIRKGLSKEYVYKVSTKVIPKGKINISKTIAEQTLLRKKIVCEYDIFSEDILINQIIKSVALYILKHKKSSYHHRKELKKSLLFFNTVSDIPISKIEWKKVLFIKNNITYEMLINICYMLINELIHSEDVSSRKNIKQIFDEQTMAKLFERFVLAYYKKHFPALNACSKQIKWHTSTQDLTYLPKMTSDIFLKYKDFVLIIDTKYYSQVFQVDKRYGSKTIRSDHLYQIFAYTKNQDVTNTGNIEGLLLYAKPENEMDIDVSYVLSDSKISVKTIDMNRNFFEISNQLDTIVWQWLRTKNTDTDVIIEV